MFYPFSIKVNKCIKNCNIIKDPYTKLCVPDVFEGINVQVLNLMSRTNEPRHIEWHKTCKCTYRLDARICNNKQRWNGDKCRCKCKELIDKGIYDKNFIGNPSYYECECDESFDIREYSHYKNCECRNKIFDKLVEECSRNIDATEMLYNETLNAISLKTKACNFCTIYIVLFAIFLIITINVGSAFIYFH